MLSRDEVVTESTSSKRVYVAVAGNIGAGKSTLVDFLCRTYRVEPFFEPFQDNPYLADFYDDMKRWSFHSQVYFLAHKFRVHQDLDQVPGAVIQDRTIYEDAEVFAKALYRSKKMSSRDYETYTEMYSSICNAIKPPDLLIYLRCSVRALRKRIRFRGRPMEMNIPTSYLRLLQGLYDEWLSQYSKSDVMIIDSDRLDYISDLEHRLDVMERIEAVLPTPRRIQNLG